MFINYIIIYILFLLHLTFEEKIIIPFKIIQKVSPEYFLSLDDYFTYWHELSFYSELLIGTPEQKILTKLTFYDYGISILNKGCDYDSYLMNINNALNIKDTSSSFIKTNDIYDDESFNYKKFYDAFYARDNIYFNNKIKSNLKFIYSPNDNQQISTCLNFGFMAYTRNLRENNLNLIMQLKKSNVINNYDWSILFNEGVFLLGTTPHEYKPELYNENNLYGSAYYYDDLIAYFNLQVNKIYFHSNKKSDEDIHISDSNILYLIPTKGLIKGTPDYEFKIEKDFFNDFIFQNKCFKEFTNNNKYRTFTCINNPSVKEELRTKFPKLYFEHKNFLYTFELNFDDLFKSKGDKIYFLVFFETSVNPYWEMGLPFMKKYVFNYNYDNKIISFYNNNFKETNEKNKNSNIKIGNIILILIFSILVCVLGFILGKKIRKKKRLTAEELELNFSLGSQENNNMESFNNK